MNKKIFGIIVCTLFLFSMFLPNINAIRTIETNILTEGNNEGLVGNLSIGTESTNLRTIITNIFNTNPDADSYLFYYYIANFNIINVTVEQQHKLESLKGDKILELNETSTIKNGSATIWRFYEEDFSGYLFGFVKYKWAVKVLEDNSSVTKNLLGFVFKYGIKWFFNH